ncbi:MULTISPECIES: VacJ family lipoprotein [unclassified Sphingomonas]|uniref:MlaA family lipoprotein n=1 Tax=unclassified Sphingomonas TaxID=196159 RepID=UPI002269D86D|nr:MULTISPECIES: VacJ family lipoprotein [unclassified Sphingomonas]
MILLPALLPALLAAAPVAASSGQAVAPVVVGPAPAAVRPHHAKGDPLEGFNRRMFRAHQGFDRRFFRPAAMGYKHALPKVVRGGLRNVIRNLGEPIVFLNYLLQLKPGKAAETAGRFLINSTLGFGGLVDMAKTPGVKLPHRDNGLGNTLAFYGVKPGPYLFLPFVGPTTLRDLIGGRGDALVLPLAIGSPFDRLEYQIPKGVISGLDARAEADDDLNALFAGAVDPYATLRSVYLQNRVAEIQQLKGAKKAKTGPELDDPLADPSGAGAPAASPELSDPLDDPAAPTPAPGSAAPAASPAPVTSPELSDPLADPAAPATPQG